MKSFPQYHIKSLACNAFVDKEKMARHEFEFNPLQNNIPLITYKNSVCSSQETHYVSSTDQPVSDV
jgi:hypothetical protein